MADRRTVRKVSPSPVERLVTFRDLPGNTSHASRHKKKVSTVTRGGYINPCSTKEVVCVNKLLSANMQPVRETACTFRGRHFAVVSCEQINVQLRRASASKQVTWLNQTQEVPDAGCGVHWRHRALVRQPRHVARDRRLAAV